MDNDHWLVVSIFVTNSAMTPIVADPVPGSKSLGSIASTWNGAEVQRPWLRPQATHRTARMFSGKSHGWMLGANETYNYSWKKDDHLYIWISNVINDDWINYYCSLKWLFIMGISLKHAIYNGDLTVKYMWIELSTKRRKNKM